MLFLQPEHQSLFYDGTCIQPNGYLTMPCRQSSLMGTICVWASTDSEYGLAVKYVYVCNGRRILINIPANSH